MQRWQPPTVNTLKVNVDGAFLTEEGTGAVGAVARDSDGNFVMAISRRLSVVSLCNNPKCNFNVSLAS
jgi:ribonuclease HI